MERARFTVALNLRTYPRIPGFTTVAVCAALHETAVSFCSRVFSPDLGICINAPFVYDIILLC